MKNFFNFFVAALGTAIGTGSNFLIQVYLANKLSITDFGFFTSIFNIINLLSPIVAFGVTGFLLKSYSEEGENTKKWFRAINIFNILSILLSFILFNVFFFEEQNKILVMMFFIFLLSISFNNFTLLKFQVAGDFKNYAIWLALPNFLRLVLLLLFIGVAGLNIFGVGLLFCIASLIVLLVSFYSVFELSKGTNSIKNTANVNKNIIKKHDIKELFGNVYPYGLASVFYLIYYQIDIVVLKYYVAYEQIAYYGVAVIFVSAVRLLPAIFYQQICMPKIHYWSISDKKRLENFYKKNLFYSFGLGVVFYILINLIIGYVIEFLFGNKYLEIMNFFYIISLIIPLNFISQSAGSILNIHKWIKVKVYIMGAAAIINLISNLALVSSIGLYGAIYSTLLTELFLMIFFVGYLKLNFRKIYE